MPPLRQSKEVAPDEKGVQRWKTHTGSMRHVRCNNVRAPHLFHADVNVYPTIHHLILDSSPSYGNCCPSNRKLTLDFVKPTKVSTLRFMQNQKSYNGLYA